MKRQPQRGFSLLELMAALAIGMFMLLGLTTIMDSSLQDAKGQQTAQHQATFASAAARYLDDNYSTLLASPNPVGTTAAVPLATLQGSGYLPPSFAAQNIYQQTPCMLIRKNTATQLEVLLVTEGGVAIPDADIGYVAANAGTGGGAITYVTPNVPASGLIARGAYGSWLLDETAVAPAPRLSDFIGSNCPGRPAATNGNLATALFYGSGQSGADFLYRKNVAGSPGLNQMSTPIGMTGAAIKVAGTVGCGADLALAMDSIGHLLTCIGNTWTEPSSWKAPVGSYALLPPIAAPGDVVATLDTGRAFVRDNLGNWVPLGLDQNGDLNNVNNVAVGGNVAMTGTAPANGNLTMPGNLTVGGTQTLAGGLNMGGNLALTGIAPANGNLTMKGDLRMDGTLVVQQNARVMGIVGTANLSMYEQVAVGSPCNVPTVMPDGSPALIKPPGTLIVDFNYITMMCHADSTVPGSESGHFVYLNNTTTPP
ncbi:shufflon system plasmid conjugative transfer pilus tip adhesin PilV [Actimicrobium sp. CCC2.4]|uniref:shufflon system plasmid conjugative transfer pilus tip adhesin PilV n=1 Tax=Actimicrobium sp. CCC2.4 TaxID=3048606 RepID=UPI002AC9561B|nr:shufflon system plasmid conjugative transfer pilus tip adhesin PilV [Actimicrobium sp. CCC2.4]MEB0134420.1 shufflon system plasmid conjugative transfer pilus tip adhesin PilV [Actimicrobium sp. CCC2.4]WPX33056.1 shufflon system plasmid conjugative transfer pilus tip adhesin PilV [Actimicrobium sp. CCC2.4]